MSGLLRRPEVNFIEYRNYVESVKLFIDNWVIWN